MGNNVMNIEFNKIEDTWLQMLHAMLTECAWLLKEWRIKKDIADDYMKILTDLDQELKTRSLNEISINSDISDFPSLFGRREPPLDLPIGLVLGNLTDNEARVLYALGAEISDFSCLGRGVRKYVESVWLGFEKELEKRGIEREFFCDLEM